jgi:hypothetical protein
MTQITLPDGRRVGLRPDAEWQPLAREGIAYALANGTKRPQRIAPIIRAALDEDGHAVFRSSVHGVADVDFVAEQILRAAGMHVPRADRRRLQRASAKASRR